MTTPNQALGELAELYIQYCPLLDQLMTATRDNVTVVVSEEQRLAERIWQLGKIAFGARGASLHMLKPDADECEEIIDTPILSVEHRAALIGCCVRSKRLRKLLDESDPGRAGAVMARALELYLELVDKLDRPLKYGEAASLNREVAEEIGCLPDTVKKAVQRHEKGTVPK